MELWQERLLFDPMPPLLASGNDAVKYFTNRDLLKKRVEPVSSLWLLPEVQNILKKQQPDGSWKYHGMQRDCYPKHFYSLFETWRVLRNLVDEYGFTKEHSSAEKAAEFIFSCQEADGDFRGFLGNQYATYYTGDVLALLIRAGYENDSRTIRGLEWLLAMRQDDGGWTIPILTHNYGREKTHQLTSRYAEPVEADRSKPFSHNWTDMALRAFAAHPKYRKSEEAKKAASLLKAQFFLPDYYSSYHAASYWVRFLFWWPNLLTAMESLTLMGYTADDPDMMKGLKWFVGNQEANGLWKTTYVKGKMEPLDDRSRERRLWVTLRVCRIFERHFGRS